MVTTEDNSYAKILLMGNTKVGKTSMRAIIFSNFSAKDTFNLGWTNYVECAQMNYIGRITLNLLDCGGQKKFRKQYFEGRNTKMFENVKLLIFILEAQKRKPDPNSNSNDDDDLLYLKDCGNALSVSSKSAKIFVGVNKMDGVQPENKERVYEERVKEIMKTADGNFDVTCFPTSIWEDSLYHAWTAIVTSLMMDVENLKKEGNSGLIACGAGEIILFEKNTFLPICHVNSKEIKDEQRFEKIATNIKRIKRSFKTQIYNMIVVMYNKGGTWYGDDFTTTSNILVVIGKVTHNFALISYNISMVRNKFEDMMNPPDQD